MGTNVTLAPISWTVSAILVPAKIREVHCGPVNPAGRTRLDQVAGLLAADRQVAARHLDGDLLVHESRAHARRGDGARARAGSERVARPALPYLHAHARAINYLEQLNVGALGEGRVRLEVRTQLETPLDRDRLVEHDAVRVADRDEHGLDGPNWCLKSHSIWLAVEPGRQVGGSKRRTPDVDLTHDFGAVPGEDVNGVRASGGPELETIARPVLEDGVGGGDAQPVAALLGLRTIRVEDSNAHLRRIEGQQAVGAQAQMAVTQRREERDHLVERRGEVQDQVIVAQGLVFNEIDSH